MIRNETSVGSSQTHQCPHDPLAQIEPVIRTPTPNTSERWIATYERMSQRGSRVRRCAIAARPPKTKPQSVTIASGTWM